MILLVYLPSHFWNFIMLGIFIKFMKSSNILVRDIMKKQVLQSFDLSGIIFTLQAGWHSQRCFICLCLNLPTYYMNVMSCKVLWRPSYLVHINFLGQNLTFHRHSVKIKLSLSICLSFALNFLTTIFHYLYVWCHFKNIINSYIEGRDHCFRIV